MDGSSLFKFAVNLTKAHAMEYQQVKLSERIIQSQRTGMKWDDLISETQKLEADASLLDGLIEMLRKQELALSKNIDIEEYKLVTAVYESGTLLEDLKEHGVGATPREAIAAAIKKRRNGNENQSN